MDSVHFLTGREVELPASQPVSVQSRPDPISSAAPKGTWFDEAIDFHDPVGSAFTGEVLAIIAAVETRKRKRRPEAAFFHRLIIRRILANGLRCHYFRDPSRVAFFRKADGYKKGPRWLSGEAMGRSVDLLVQADLVNFHCGKQGVSASTYSATEKLCEVAQACGVTDRSLTVRLSVHNRVRLRAGNAATARIDFDQTAETSRWTDQLQAHGRFLSQQDIRLDMTPEEAAEWVRHWNENKQKRWNGDVDRGRVTLCRPELIQTGLYRQFNNGSFDQGGRMYGGWWINTPKTLRPKITINGRPIAELDFSGCAIRMLYHLRGLDYKDDPYRLDAIAAYEIKKGLPTDYFRDGVKMITQALINDQKCKEPERIKIKKGMPSFRPRFSRLEIRKMLEAKHAAIADAFGTGAGLYLQRRESDLALEIITELMDQGVVALPVHDAFLVDMDYKTTTALTMMKLYRRKFGFPPKIKASP